MLTVREAAALSGRNPETIRRWIRSGRLPAKMVGAQHVIEEADFRDLIEFDSLPIPKAWKTTATGEPMPDVVGLLRAARVGR